MKKRLVVAFKLSVAVGLLWYLIASGDLDLAKLGAIESWGWILAAQVLAFFMLSATFIRWHLLLRAQDIEYDFRESYQLGFIGFFFNQFVPGSTGGDLVKAYYVAVEHPERRLPGIVSVFLDRALGLLMLVAICAVASVVNNDWIQRDPDMRWFAVCVLAICGGALLATLVFFNDRIRSSRIVRAAVSKLPLKNALGTIQASVYTYKHHRGIVFAAVAISIAVHLTLVLMAYCYARALASETPPIAVFFFLVPLANLAMAVPISPGGLGVGEFAYIRLFREVGYANGDVIAVLNRLSYYAWALVGLALYLSRRKRVDRAMAAAETDAQADDESTAPSRDGHVPEASGREDRSEEKESARGGIRTPTGFPTGS